MTDLIKQVQEACAAELDSMVIGSFPLKVVMGAIGDHIRALDLSHLTGWQDISTAPKDGTSFLGYTTEGICEMSWLYNEWAQSPCYSTYDGAGCAVLSCQPTHWMPTPPKPSK